MSETITAGKCSCGEPINKHFDPANPCLWADGRRYQYAETSRFHNDENHAKHPAYCIFRCEACGEPIDDRWVAA